MVWDFLSWFWLQLRLIWFSSHPFATRLMFRFVGFFWNGGQRRTGASAFFGAETACHTNCSEQDRIAQEHQAPNFQRCRWVVGWLHWGVFFFFWGGGWVQSLGSNGPWRGLNDVKRWRAYGQGRGFCDEIHEFWVKFTWCCWFHGKKALVR